MKNRKILKSMMSLVLTLALFVTLIPIQAKGASNSLPKNEMRAAWIATVTNIDMKAGMNQSQYTTWVKSTLDKLKADNFNAVIFQVKPTNDALYPSKLAPWSSYITGKKQGTNPGYDPLQIMTDEAHKRGMELHAWINPYRVTMKNQSLSTLSADNAAIKNTSWVVKYGSQYFLNPGMPEVQNYLISTVRELVENYDIDGVHMDDYFYPYKIPGQEFSDQAAFKKYGAAFKTVDDWRRNNVNVLVKNIYEEIKSIKSHVQFGISPFGVWRNKSLDPTGSDTQAGVNNYDDLYADTRQWIKDGSIDYITPQIYWSRSLAVANYSKLLDWWSKEVETYAKVHQVNLYIGVADYKVGNDSDSAWNNKMELPNQILANRANGVAKGQMHFSLKDYQKNALGYATIVKQQMYNYKALTPATPWKGNTVSQKPTAVRANVETLGIKLVITDQNSTQPRKYVIYRFDGSKEGSYQDPKNIIDVIYHSKGTTEFVDQTADKNKTYTYGVKAVSATGVESQGAAIAKIGEVEETPGGDTDPGENAIFKDIPSTHRAFKEITYLAQGNITSGDKYGNFNPNLNVTRGEAAAMIGRALNLDGTQRESTFNDVSTSMFASGYIQSAADLKILSGYKDGSFKPYANVTRGEMALMISRAFEYNYGNTTAGAAEALISRGIAQGMGDGTFGANLSIIRADFAVFLARGIDYTLRVKPSITFNEEMSVNTNTLSIRKGPSNAYTQLGTLTKNEKVQIGYKVGSWSLVKSQSGVIGFVPNSSLIK
ncbi:MULTISPECIES: family 10 glycosylhydrolase [Bacillus]|uniref:family 10 glycosylhydrolase n=1 Tax=Bacillus TaxID=1386 RepID=UPI00030997E1|nr:MULTISPECIES: family 10 glycosylhydrolase [Bacillus]